MIVLMCLAACQDLHIFDEPVENETFSLYVGSTDRYVVKSPENPEFSEGTLFHIYGTEYVKDAADDWSDNLIKAESIKGPGVFKGVAGEPDAVRTKARIVNSYDQGQPITPVFRTKNLNLYSVTAVCARADYGAETNEELQSHNDQLESWLDGDAAIPAYDVKYDKVNTESMPDIMWSTLKNLTPYGNAGKISMPFTHTLSKLNFIGVKADGLDSGISGMKIKSLSLTDYPEGRLSMENGLYTRGNNQRTWSTTAVDFGDGGYEVTSGTEEPFGSCLIFPTTGAGYDVLFTGEVSDDQAVKVALTVETTRTDGTVEEKTFDNVKLVDVDGKNASFQPNTEYFITFTLTTNQAIVTLVPKYYEYIKVDMPVGDNEVGEPTDFGGVLWAAENLGASSAAPTKNALEWEKARGFYYQFGRNVPYYVRGSILDPYPGVAIHSDATSATNEYWDYEYEKRYLYDPKSGTANNIQVPYGNTQYQAQKNHGARAYPYIPILWENEISKAGGNADTGYKNYLKGTRLYHDFTKSGTATNRTGQSAPAVNHSDPHEAQGVIDSNGDITTFAFTSYYGNSRYWNKLDKTNSTAPQNWLKDGGNESDPCPKGWRVPTVEEFKSIFPTNVRQGDISFNTAGTGQDDGASVTPHNGKVLWTEKNPVNSGEKSTDYKGDPAIYIGIYQDGKGNNNIGTFIVGTGTESNKQGWGTIYGIKRLSTEEAYGIRWEIVTVDYDKEAGAREANVEPVIEAFDKYPKIGRGVLVISKYDLEYEYAKESICITSEATGAASAAQSEEAQYICKGFVDSNRNRSWDSGEKKFDIDWDHPSGKLYLPIPGYVIVPSAGGQALIYPGTECLYWSSDVAESNKGGQAVRIKHAGDNLSRQVYISGEEYIANGANIRCVRDTRATD